MPITDYEWSVREALPASGLQWNGATEEQLQFMRNVYNHNVSRSSANRSFLPDIPEGELEEIEGGIRIRTAAARSCRSLLAAARDAIRAAAVRVEVGLTSGYRSASHQFRLWQGYFPNYYAETATERASMSGGSHGAEAVRWMGRYVGARIATPGFSNHQNGIAVDLLNGENGISYRNSSRPAAVQAWKGSWFWEWLGNNASRFHFYQNTLINEPWHWEYRAPVAEEWEDAENAIIAPNVIGRETAPPRETIYVDQGIGISSGYIDKAKKHTAAIEAKTGIFIPQSFQAEETNDILLYLHGHKSDKLGKDKSIDRLWNKTEFPHFALRELVNETGRNIIMVAPTLGPRSQPGELVTSAGFSNFMVHIIAAINSHLSHHFNGGLFRLDKLFLACHSGGGEAMKGIAALADENTYAAHISECWGFDSIYSSNDPSKWEEWAKKHTGKKVYQYYIPNTQTADQGDVMKEKAKKGGISNLIVVGSTERRHDWVPARYLRERLSAGVPVYGPSLPPSREEDACCMETTEEEWFGETTVVYPSSEQLTVVSGPEAPGEEYHDPNGSGNPLLDTSGANRSKKLSTNFTVGEFAKSGSRTFDKARIDVELVKCLQAIRDRAGKSVTITSGYRSFGYNEELRAKSSNVVTKSQHMSGRAADIQIDKMTGFEIAKLALDAYSCNLGIGLAPGFAHIDVRGTFAVWRYGGDPSYMTPLVEQLRQYRAQCVNKGASTPLQQPPSPASSPGTLAAVIDYLKLLYPSLLDSANLLRERCNCGEYHEGQRCTSRGSQPYYISVDGTEGDYGSRVGSAVELVTSWTAEFEKELQRTYGGSPRNMTRQNLFNKALFAAQNEWEELDPFILKSLLAQESNFLPEACNSLGFAGIAQLGMAEARAGGLSTGNSLEQTAAHRKRQETYPREAYDFVNDERFDASKAIPAAARLLKKKWQSLDRSVFRKWGQPSGEEMYLFLLSAYNGGEGTIKKRIERIYGTTIHSPLKFEDLGTGAWIQYARIIVERARQ